MNVYIRFLLSILLIPLLSEGILAQKTFTGDVAEIIYNHCTVCHRPGEIGPFSMTNYEEVKNFASTIKYVTSIKYMPPWKPDPEYSHFLEENYLSDEEIQTIADWVDAGTPYGDASEEPPLPEFPVGSLLGEPDLVLSFAESHLHKGNGLDEYRYFVLPTGLTEDKVIKSMELRPGNSRIVHHALFFEDVTGYLASIDAQSPEYGIDGFNEFEIDNVLNYDQYPGYVPGTKPRYYPDGLGQTLSANSDLVIQMHYAPWNVDQRDSSSVNIFFADENEDVRRTVKDRILLPFDIVNGLFFISGGQVRTFEGVWNITSDVSLLGLSPHMHLLGTSWEVYLELPDGTRENLISIPDWDFNWQGAYYFDRFKVAPAGSKIHAFASYDNTSSNPNNPANPPVFVSWGEGTNDEMYYLPIFYVDYEDGDENVVFDINTSTEDPILDFGEHKIYPISPNPVAEGLVATKFSLAQGGAVNISILNMSGQVVKELREYEFFNRGTHLVHFDATTLNSGVYFVHISGKRINLTEKFVKY